MFERTSALVPCRLRFTKTFDKRRIGPGSARDDIVARPLRTGRAFSLPLLFLASFGTACSSAPPRASHAAASQPAATPSATPSAVILDKTAIAVADDEAKAPGLANADEVPTEDDGTPRIGALGPHTWIYRKASRDGLAIGKMRPGTSVRLKSKDPIDGLDCKAKWYAIEPRGFICADNTATLNLADPYYKALAFSAPSKGTFPYRYAHSNGSPMYSRVPTQEEWEKEERGFGPVNHHGTLGAWAKGHEELIIDDPIVADETKCRTSSAMESAPPRVGCSIRTSSLGERSRPARCSRIHALSKRTGASGFSRRTRWSSLPIA